MIKIFAIKNKKLNDKLTLDSIKSKDLKKAQFFIDCFKPTKKEIEILASKFSLEQFDINLALDTESRPRILDHENYSTIIFASVLSSKSKSNKSKINTSSFGMLLCNNSLIFIRDTPLASIEKFKNLADDKKMKELVKGNGYMTYLIMDFIFDNYFQVTDFIEDKINRLESKVFKNPDESTVKNIFRIKTELIYMHKALTANREVIASIEKGYLRNIRTADIKRFNYVYHDATQLIDIEGTYRDIITGILDIYVSSVSNKLNDIIKKMTAMASFILIPTLISGIYGMNFRFLPEFAWKYGYVFALSLMIISVVIMYFYFKKKKWL
ncbi:MAG: magnesium/cobalt transporter CorA [Nanoarchaeota archaeon]|nr:magnesium/cobalt transporter CorA [Nanoarchaeota archaeon]